MGIKKLFIIAILLIGCKTTADHALQYAIDSYPLCDVIEVSRTNETVTVDIYCGCGYPKRATYQEYKRRD